MMIVLMKDPMMLSLIAAALSTISTVKAYSILPRCFSNRATTTAKTQQYLATSTTTTTTTTSSSTDYSFIDTELRGAAMRLHTREQAYEGQAETPKPPQAPQEPYTPTRTDYLAFLVDSQHVYATMEEIVQAHSELSKLCHTGLERTTALNHDIEYLCQTYHLERPDVGAAGRTYSQLLRDLVDSNDGNKNIPAFCCHFYNFYFAHTAGGRMIGKKMSSLLLDGKTLEFYKWENGNLNQMKQAVKQTIEEMAANWSEDERKACVQATAAAFEGGGALNSYLLK